MHQSSIGRKSTIPKGGGTMTASRMQKSSINQKPFGSVTESGEMSMNYSESEQMQRSQLQNSMGKDSKHCCTNQSRKELNRHDEASAEDNAPIYISDQ